MISGVDPSLIGLVRFYVRLYIVSALGYYILGVSLAYDTSIAGFYSLGKLYNVAASSCSLVLKPSRRSYSASPMWPYRLTRSKPVHRSSEGRQSHRIKQGPFFLHASVSLHEAPVTSNFHDSDERRVWRLEFFFFQSIINPSFAIPG